MASTEEYSSKIAPESQAVPRNERKASFFLLDVTLRVFLLAACVAGIVLLVTSKQTKIIPVLLPTGQIFNVPNSAKFQHSPAFIYLLAALSVAGFYSIISILASLASKKYYSKKHVFLFTVLDLLMVGVLASATGAAGGIEYTGLKGNSHARWGKICNVYGDFCRHVGASTGLSLVSSIVLIMLIMLSTYTLYRRSS
ncbi:hypothetical protein ACHQM5_026735 [Ranunculus cassubicifolius]